MNDGNDLPDRVVMYPSPALRRTVSEERLDWYLLSPRERFEESERLLAQYLSMGGKLDTSPDPGDMAGA